MNFSYSQNLIANIRFNYKKHNLFEFFGRLWLIFWISDEYFWKSILLLAFFIKHLYLKKNINWSNSLILDFLRIPYIDDVLGSFLYWCDFGFYFELFFNEVAKLYIINGFLFKSVSSWTKKTPTNCTILLIDCKLSFD